MDTDTSEPHEPRIDLLLSEYRYLAVTVLERIALGERNIELLALVLPDNVQDYGSELEDYVEANARELSVAFSLLAHEQFACIGDSGYEGDDVPEDI